MWGRLAAIMAAIAAFFGAFFAIFTGAQAKKNLNAIGKVKDDFDKIDAKAKNDKRPDDDVLKGGVK